MDPAPQARMPLNGLNIPGSKGRRNAELASRRRGIRPWPSTEPLDGCNVPVLKAESERLMRRGATFANLE
jgi:hypothetical protein